MNISWQWLSELIDLKDITPEDLAEQLTLASFEVEDITKNIYQDTILNISTTSNRSDTLSIVGIAREIAAILKKPYKKTWYRFPLDIKYENIYHINNQCCNQIYTSIYNIKIKPSPKWLQFRLINHNIKPQNNLLDILNFISIKWGQHFEVYDLDKVHQKHLDDLEIQCISETQSGTFISRNNEYLNLSNKKLNIIKNYESTLGITGFCAIQNSGVDKNTKNLIIQGTICNPKYIKDTSKILNISTKESKLQEKGINESDLLNGYHEALFLLSYLTEGITKQTIYKCHTQYIYRPIYIYQQNIIDVLGPEQITSSLRSTNTLNLNTVALILKDLRLVTYTFTNYLQINIPLDRINDIYRNIDIIEEIVRIYGFNQFIDRMPLPLNYQYGIKQLTHYKLAHIRSVLRSLGMHETMHTSLIKDSGDHLAIHNPLTEDLNALRKNLLNNLLDTYIYNINQGNEGIDIFETGRIFYSDKTQFIESIHLAGLIGGESSNRLEWSRQPSHLSWFQAKGQLEEFFERINLRIIWKNIDTQWYLYHNTYKYFHPKYVAMLYREEKPIGIFGEINGEFTAEITKKIYGFEIILDHLPIQEYRSKNFADYSKYPSIIRDINIPIHNNTPYDNILKKLEAYKNPLVESIKLFDVYINMQEQKNIGLRITYRSQDTTLTNIEIDNLENQLKQKILSGLS